MTRSTCRSSTGSPPGGGSAYLAQALAVLVEDGVLDAEEALDAGAMILHRNTREVYNLPKV